MSLPLNALRLCPISTGFTTLAQPAKVWVLRDTRHVFEKMYSERLDGGRLDIDRVAQERAAQRERWSAKERCQSDPSSFSLEIYCANISTQPLYGLPVTRSTPTRTGLTILMKRHFDHGWARSRWIQQRGRSSCVV